MEIGNGLELQVIAEGIERPDQLRLMQSFGCEYGQGYLFSAPLDAADVLRLLRDDSSPLAQDQDDRVSVGAVA